MITTIRKFARGLFLGFATYIWLDAAWRCFTAASWPAEARIGPEAVGTLCLIAAALSIAWAFGFLDEDRSEA